MGGGNSFDVFDLDTKDLSGNYGSSRRLANWFVMSRQESVRALGGK
jgi:hypothetical protein